MKKFVLFSDRLKLSKLFYEWAEKHGLEKSAFNCISFLDSLGLIDVDNAVELVKDVSITGEKNE